jgi:hypothetical protein
MIAAFWLAVAAFHASTSGSWSERDITSSVVGVRVLTDAVEKVGGESGAVGPIVEPARTGLIGALDLAQCGLRP